MRIKIFCTTEGVSCWRKSESSSFPFVLIFTVKTDASAARGVGRQQRFNGVANLLHSTLASLFGAFLLQYEICAANAAY